MKKKDLINRVKDTEERISSIKDKVEEMDSLVKENNKSKKKSMHKI